METWKLTVTEVSEHESFSTHICLTPSNFMSTASADAPSFPRMAKTLIEVEVEVRRTSTEVAATTGTGGAPVEQVCTHFLATSQPQLPMEVSIVCRSTRWVTK